MCMSVMCVCMSVMCVCMCVMFMCMCVMCTCLFSWCRLVEVRISLLNTMYTQHPLAVDTTPVR